MHGCSPVPLLAHAQAAAHAARPAPRPHPTARRPAPPPARRRLAARAVRNGHIKRLTDGDIQSSVLEVAGTNVSTTYIACPAEPKRTLGIKLPFLVMIIKNLKKYLTFEVTILDDKNVHRRFRASNFQVRAGARRPSSQGACSLPPAHSNSPSSPSSPPSLLLATAASCSRRRA